MGQWFSKQNRPQHEGVFLHFVDEVRFDVYVYGSVPGEGSAPFFVFAEAADQVWVLDFVVEVSDKSSAG